MTIEEIAIKTMARDIGKHLQDITRLETTNAALVEALEAVLSECQVAAPLNLGRWDDEYYEAFNIARAALKLAKGE